MKRLAAGVSGVVVAVVSLLGGQLGLTPVALAASPSLVRSEWPSQPGWQGTIETTWSSVQLSPTHAVAAATAGEAPSQDRRERAPAPTMGDLLFSTTAIHPDGTSTDLTLPEGLHDSNFDAAYSPDGASLAVVVELDDNNMVLQKVNSKGETATIAELKGFSDVRGLDWSPDGSALALTGRPTAGSGDGRWEFNLYRVDVTSGAVRVLVQSTNSVTVLPGEPSWSPNGDRIAFAMGVETESVGYVGVPFTVSANGGTPTRYSSPRECDLRACWTMDSGPTWASDGASLYGFNEDGGTLELMQFREGSSEPTSLARLVPRMTFGSGYTGHGSPQVSLDGGHIVVPTLLYENRNVYHRTFRYEGGQLTLDLSGPEANPADWQPCPTGSCVRWSSECSEPSKDPVTCYAPVVRLHPEEITFPMNVQTFVEYSRLMWNRDHGCKDEVVASKIEMARLGYRAAKPYRAQEAGAFPRCKASGRVYASDDLTKPGAPDKPSGLDKEEGFYLDLDDTMRLGSSPVDNRVRTGAFYSRSRDGRAITYWFMYGFNQGAPGAGSRVDRHEGEWERVTVDLNKDDTARQVRYWQHECSSPETVSYSNVSVDGTHPVVYAALGSHASFPSVRSVGKSGLCPLFGQQSIGQGWGDRTADGGAVWNTWETSLKNAADQPWYGYGGAWGEIGGNEKLGITACQSAADILDATQDCVISVTGPLGPPHKNLFAYP